jgi:hypothetical protein
MIEIVWFTPTGAGATILSASEEGSGGILTSTNSYNKHKLFLGLEWKYKPGFAFEDDIYLKKWMDVRFMNMSLINVPLCEIQQLKKVGISCQSCAGYWFIKQTEKMDSYPETVR